LDYQLFFIKFKPAFLSSWAFKFSASLFAYAASQAGRHLSLMKYAQAFQNPNNYLCKSCNNSAPLSVTKFRNQSNWSTWNNWIDDSTRRRRRRRGSSAPQRDLTSSLRQPKRLHPLVKCLGFNQGGCLPAVAAASLCCRPCNKLHLCISVPWGAEHGEREQRFLRGSAAGGKKLSRPTAACLPATSKIGMYQARAAAAAAHA
jgi:hypothetical protein